MIRAVFERQTLLHVSALAGLPCAALPNGKFPLHRSKVIAAARRLGLPLERQAKQGSQSALFLHVAAIPADTACAMFAAASPQNGAPSTGADFNSLIHLPASSRIETMAAFRRLEEFRAEFAKTGDRRKSAETVATRCSIHYRTIYRDLARVEGYPATEWLPALARSHSGGRPKAAIQPEVWTYFLSMKAAGSNQPWAAVYRKLKKAAAAKGWDVPSLKTLLRRVDSDVSAATMALVTSGPKALDALYPAQERTVAHLAALEIVNLDGRRADVFVRWEDGEIGRPIVIALQDVMSRKMLGWIVAKTENADDTKAMLLRVMRQYGRFLKLRTDNSRAFASKKIVGGAAYQFRWKPIHDELTGILPLMGIEPGFALPANGRAKPIERAFKDVSSDIDRLPEFKRAFCGNRPDAKPEEFDGTAVDVAVFRETFEREIAEHNAREGRRTEMAAGIMSFDQVFDASYALQPRRPLTAEQERYFHSEVVYLAPNENGALKHKGFTWWAAEYQDLLISHRGTKLRVSFNPDSMSEAVAVETPDGKLLAARLPCLAKGRFDSTEGARQHARGKAQYKKAARAGLKALDLMTRAELMAFDAEMRAASAGSPPAESASNIIEPLFATKAGKRGKATSAVAASPIAAVAGLTQADRDEFARGQAEGQRKLLAIMREAG